MNSDLEEWSRYIGEQKRAGKLAFPEKFAAAVGRVLRDEPSVEQEQHARRDALLREAATTLSKASDDLQYGYWDLSTACDALAARIRKELGE